MPIPEFDTSPADNELDSFIAQDPTAQADFIETKAWLDELAGMDDGERKKYVPPDEVMRRFRTRVLEVYEDPPLSKEEIASAFTPENLSGLSLLEYVRLLRRVPSKFITHITRHGFRDRASHHNYDGDTQFHHGFEGLLEKKQIQSVLDQTLENKPNVERVRSILKKIGIPGTYNTKNKALDRLTSFLDREANPWIQSEFADNNAVHGAIDYVPDWYYGGETGNQIFILYPAALIASQYECADQNFNVPKRFHIPQERRHDDKNDIWMMRKSDKRGVLPLDAGIVFIPANTRVNPKTGSIYTVDENGIQPEGKPLTQEFIPAQEYWENYFQELGYRPSKIIYYDQEDPNEALEEFRSKARLPEGLHGNVDLTDIFSENMLGQLKMRDVLSQQRTDFRTIAKKIIAEFPDS